MRNITRKLSLPALILAVICFVFPFVSFSCAGQKVATFSGLQLATGTTVERPEPFGSPLKQKIDPEPLALLALPVILVGIGASIVNGKKGAIGSTALSGLGFILLIALKAKIDNDVLKQTAGAIQVNYQAGFYLATLFLIVAAGTSVFAIFQNKNPPLTVAGGPADSKSCAQCGAPNASSNQCCSACGARFG